ncbi:MAG: tRNA (guanosine(46)-N7)-methyltransferase TrmB [Bacteroidota bacterium]|nr:tRNA (guanosine(46)-N7)-methyltransferase TrmB [Bacteroidota bacterium]
MAQNKLQRFQAINSFANVLQYPEGMPGHWKDFFKNENPLVLELACGKGEYTVALSTLYPQRNFIGVDLKGNRIYVGASKCLKNNLHNAAFLRTQIDKIDQYFLPGEVSEIWITFPDPHLRISRAKKRLTHPRFLRLYQKILKREGLIHLKTDSPVLFNFTKLILELYGLPTQAFSEDVYAHSDISEELAIKTHYEMLDIAQSRKIFYLSFTLPAEPLPVADAQLNELLKEIEKN